MWKLTLDFGNKSKLCSNLCAPHQVPYCSTNLDMYVSPPTIFFWGENLPKVDTSERQPTIGPF
jgi:hypothetical protein